MTTIDTGHFKTTLEEELATLIESLKEVAVLDESGDWIAKVDNDGAQVSDRGEIADKSERLYDNIALLDSLELRYTNINRALTKITNGTFGVCEIDKKQIEADRLEVNPAARTCKEHINDEDTLPM